jgi:hypothetical protein
MDDLERQVDAVFAQKNIACQQCFFYAPKHPVKRCLHPHARQIIRDWEGEHVIYMQPEKRNRDRACPDFKRGVSRGLNTDFATIIQAILVLFGVLFLWSWMTQ